MKNKKGLTLLEFLAVMLILTIIAGISYPIYNTFIRDADGKTHEMKENELFRLLETWYQTNHYIPIIDYDININNEVNDEDTGVVIDGDVSNTVTHKKYSYDQVRSQCNIFIDYNNPSNSLANICLLDADVLNKEKTIKINDGDKYYVYITNNNLKISYDIPSDLIEFIYYKYSPSVNNNIIQLNDGSGIISKYIEQFTIDNLKFDYILLSNGRVDRIYKG